MYTCLFRLHLSNKEKRVEMIPSEWITVNRPGDRETVGYLEMLDDGFVPFDLLGRQLAGQLPFEEAEELLFEHGLAYLAGRWKLTVDDAAEPIDVVIRDVGPEQVTLMNDDLEYGKPIGALFTLAVPELTGRLQPGAPGSSARFVNAIPG